MRWQADLASSTFLSEAGEILTVNSGAAASYLASDRWLAVLKFSHQLEARGHALERRPRQWAVGASAEVNYFLEDSWALRLTASESQSRSAFARYTRQGGLGLGLTYVISGFFEAPGLVSPMRPSPIP